MQERFRFRGVARATDPLSSHVAGERVRHSGVAASQQAEILEAIEAHPARTAAQLEDFCSLRKEQIGKRLPEMERAGQIERRDRGTKPAIFFAVRR